ncbi:PP2C family protein-serine/threonine phosphatase [Kitasatospora purpeofusca]|uniref:PP2C family protein-serine/threonine phosphatase n=1 Tax=Kitasatospora purpeofusca TaxID=67352 RepID=UPI002A5A9940|nr:PP2C family protein-serine/threonine phosphatase [Kitasatospora purpeofusca]MDY0816123.1 PP2C family protein-serine/threonine phosphatase [Kitasatospora purpeofusca]
MFPIRRAQSPFDPTGAGQPAARRRGALLAVDLLDIPFWRRAAPALIAIVLVGLADLLSGRDRYLAPLMTVVPSIAALTLRPLELLGVCALGLLAVFGLSHHDEVDTVNDARFLWGAMISYLLLTVFSAWVARIRMRRAAAFAAVSSVAEAAQRALLRLPGPVVGPLRLAVRYVSAADASRIGGDLYSVLETPHGTRIVVGDVRGKGLGAVQTAAVVLGAFREAAYDEAGLRGVAARIEASVERHVPDGEFTTALFAEFRRPGAVELLQCGHVPPIRVDQDGLAHVLDAPDPWVPLGLGRLAFGEPSTWGQEFGTEDVLVLCTDGVVEARHRDDGGFYPLAERVGPLVRGAARSAAELEAAVGRVYADLLAHTGGELRDDALLLLVARTDPAWTHS